MNPTYFRILLTLAACVVMAAMVWDQLRLKGMTPLKWAIVPIWLAVQITVTWT